MKRNFLKRVFTCFLSAGMVLSFVGVTVPAAETDDASIDLGEDFEENAVYDSGIPAVDEMFDVNTAAEDEAYDRSTVLEDEDPFVDATEEPAFEDDDVVEDGAVDADTVDLDMDIDDTDSSDTDDDDIMLLDDAADGEEAFAIYCEEDSSLTFYWDVAPAEGDTYQDKTVTNVYTDVDSLRLKNYSEAPWASRATSVTEVVVDGSFTKAQPVSLAYWFCYFMEASFSGLTYIDTSNVDEMESMFFACSGVTSLDVSGWDTSNVTDIGVMFSDCYSLERIEGLSTWDTSSVEYMDSLFNNCYSLQSVDVSGWDTANVTQMGYMFYECESLAGIDVSNWDTSNVEWMGSMFRNCFSLTALDVSEWDTSSVTDMSNLFYQCVALSNVNVSGWDTSHVTTMANMFIACPSLTGLDVSKWDTSSVTNMDSLFDSCTSLTNVDVSNWDTSNVKWMEYTFADCESLISLDLSSWDTGNVTYCENFATGCSALEWVAIGENTDIFRKGQAVVDQQIWYDSPTNGNVVSEDYLQDVTEPGQYWTYTEMVETVDKEKLEAEIEDAEALNESDYTPESWEAFEIALFNARAVFDDEDATQEEVDAALEALESAIKALEPATEEPEPESVDKSALWDAIQTVNGLNASDWMEDSWYELIPVWEYANTVYNDPEATQEDVDEAANELIKAIKALVPVEDDDDSKRDEITEPGPVIDNPGSGTGGTGGSGSGSDTGGTAATSAETADTNAPILYMFMIVLAGAAIVILFVSKRVYRRS